MRAAAALTLGVCLSLSLLAPVAQAQGFALALAPGDAAPRTLGKDLAGVTHDLKWTKVNVINFWATWCEPCRVEMPYLQQIHAERAADGLQVVGIIIDKGASGETVQKFIDDIGVEYTVLWPHARFLKGWGGINIFPTTFLIDENGKILRRYAGGGAEWTERLLEDIRAVLDDRPLGTYSFERTPEEPAED